VNAPECYFTRTLNSLFVLCKFTSFFRCKLAASDMHSNKSTEQ